MNMRMRQLGSQARRMALFAAATLGLIAAVNLAILVTAAWNRSAPDAELVLTEREIAARDGLFSEDSGRFVRLRIRQQDKCGALPCEPSWLDEAKRAELDIRPDVPRKDEGMKRALLVLELRDDGTITCRHGQQQQDGTWSLGDDGRICCDLFDGGGCWNICWLSGSTLVLGREEESTGSDVHYSQMMFEAVANSK